MLLLTESLTIQEAYKNVSMRKQDLVKLLFPIGRYKLAGTVVFDSCGGQIEIEGEGKETVYFGALPVICLYGDQSWGCGSV